MSRFLNDVGHPAVKANLDVSHLALVHAPPAEILELEGRIAHAHFSDCDGKKHGDLPPGRGVVDFPPYLAHMKAAGFTGTVSIELEFAPNPDKIVDWVTEAYRETDKLMQAQGCAESRSDVRSASYRTLRVRIPMSSKLFPAPIDSGTPTC